MFTGTSFVGFLCNHNDLAPNYAGILMGITNTPGTLPAFIFPAVVSLFTHDGVREMRISKKKNIRILNLVQQTTDYYSNNWYPYLCIIFFIVSRFFTYSIIIKNYGNFFLKSFINAVHVYNAAYHGTMEIRILAGCYWTDDCFLCIHHLWIGRDSRMELLRGERRKLANWFVTLYFIVKNVFLLIILFIIDYYRFFFLWIR